jgi:hypothetical protein
LNTQKNNFWKIKFYKIKEYLIVKGEGMDNYNQNNYGNTGQGGNYYNGRNNNTADGNYGQSQNPNPGNFPPQNSNFYQPQIPNNLRPLSMWEYFGYSILFCIPVIGLIFAIVFSFSNSNINRRNFARAQFCVLIICVVIGLILGLTGALSTLIYSLN